VLDVAAAQQALQAAGGWTGPLTLSFPGDDPLLAQAMEAVGNQWTQNLGIEVELNPINPNDYYPKVYALEMPGPWWDGWVMDYPSMENYLTPLYGSNGGANTFGYSSEAFDELMEQGDQQATVTDAIPYYQQADDLVLEEMPVLPWGYIDLNTVNQPTVTNVRKAGPLDLIALELVQVVGP
jgi:peptide/nickel transport system substrate-binding protein/oligopeptide transport system substrate-binding protein